MLLRSVSTIGLLAVLLSGSAQADEEGTTKGLVANGAVATVLGGAAVILGGVLYGGAQATWNQPSGCNGSCTDGNTIAEGAGLGLLAAGAAHLGVGIPLLAVNEAVPGAPLYTLDNAAAGRIWLNLELAKKPPSSLEYILVHEMVHILERHHNERFRHLMDNLMPTWRVARKELSRAPLAHDEWRY